MYLILLLQGWLPNYVVDNAMSGVLHDFLKYVRKHALRIADEERRFLSDEEEVELES